MENEEKNKLIRAIKCSIVYTVIPFSCVILWYGALYFL